MGEIGGIVQALDLGGQMSGRRHGVIAARCGGDAAQPGKVCLALRTALSQVGLDFVAALRVQTIFDPVRQVGQGYRMGIHVALIPMLSSIVLILSRHRARVGPTLPTGISMVSLMLSYDGSAGS